MIKNFQEAELIVKRRVSITLLIDVEVRDIPQAILNGKAIESLAYNPQSDDHEFLELQKRILDALLKSADHVDKMIIEEAGSTAAEELAKRWQYSGGLELDYDKLVEFLKDELLPTDVKLLAKANEEGYLSEATQLALFDTLGSRLVSIEEKIVE